MGGAVAGLSVVTAAGAGWGMRKISRWHGRFPRAKWHDQLSGGWYFVTVKTHNRLPLFGRVIDRRLELSRNGEIVAEEWTRTPLIRHEVTLGAWVVMPDHFHALLGINPDILLSLQRPTHAPTGMRRLPHGISSIVGSFKSACTRRIRQLSDSPHEVWQSGFHDEIVRSHTQWQRIAAYIENNPRNLIVAIEKKNRRANCLDSRS